MYLLNQEKPWYLSDEWYVTVEEFDAIRRMNFPKDFIDFFEIAFRTGLHEKDILNLKKENITLVKDENNNIVSGRIYGNSIKFKTPINVKLDQKSLSILTNLPESPSAGVASNEKLRPVRFVSSSILALIREIISKPSSLASSLSPWCLPVSTLRHSARPIKPTESVPCFSTSSSVSSAVSFSESSHMP